MTSTALQWNRRATRAKSGSRRWHTVDRTYMVHCSEECYGVALAPKYIAYCLIDGPHQISTHRTRAAAVKACESHARRAGR